MVSVLSLYLLASLACGMETIPSLLIGPKLFDPLEDLALRAGRLPVDDFSPLHLAFDLPLDFILIPERFIRRSTFFRFPAGMTRSPRLRIAGPVFLTFPPEWYWTGRMLSEIESARSLSSFPAL